MEKSPLTNNSDLEPVSRFWACVFASLIFALCWTQKMKKTRKWILLINLEFIVFGVIFTNSLLFDINVGDVPLNNILAIFYVIISILIIPVTVYFMFKWTTQYNLSIFGYKSKKEWRSHN